MRLWYVGPGVPEMPEGMTRPAEWQAGIEFDEATAERVLAKHGPAGTRTWAAKAPREVGHGSRD
jgi:hypothetical protein